MGTFRIEGCPFEAVTIEAGVIKGWQRRDSGTWRFSYSNVSGTQVATRIQIQAPRQIITVPLAEDSAPEGPFGND
jgi:hypothetical protein